MKNTIISPIAASILALSAGCSEAPAPNAPASNAPASDAPARDVLAAGSSLPAGFLSLTGSGAPGREGQRIEGRFQDPNSGVVIRYTTARGPMSDVAPGEPVLPIDACVRDATTGEVLVTSVFAHGYIAGCGDGDDDHAPDESAHGNDPDAEDHERKYEAAAKGLQALKSVRFRSEFEPEREILLHVARGMSDPMEEFPSGGRVVKEGEDGTVVFFDTPKAP